MGSCLAFAFVPFHQWQSQSYYCGPGASGYGPIAGLISLSAFGLNLLSARLSTLVTTDMPLALSILLLGLLIWQKTRKGEPWSSPDRWRVFALLTVSMLIKGPIVYAFLVPGIAALAWRAHKDKMTSAWSGRCPWVASLAVFLLWVTGGILFKPGFYSQVVVREFLGALVNGAPSPTGLLLSSAFAAQVCPWSVLVILLAVVLGRQTRGRMRDAIRNLSPDIFWLLCWSFGGLIVMSLVPSKRVDRIFPVVPVVPTSWCAGRSRLGGGANASAGLSMERSRSALLVFVYDRLHRVESRARICLPSRCASDVQSSGSTESRGKPLAL